MRWPEGPWTGGRKIKTAYRDFGVVADFWQRLQILLDRFGRHPIRRFDQGGKFGAAAKHGKGRIAEIGAKFEKASGDSGNQTGAVRA